MNDFSTVYWRCFLELERVDREAEEAEEEEEKKENEGQVNIWKEWVKFLDSKDDFHPYM